MLQQSKAEDRCTKARLSGSIENIRVFRVLTGLSCNLVSLVTVTVTVTVTCAAVPAEEPCIVVEGHARETGPLGADWDLGSFTLFSCCC